MCIRDRSEYDDDIMLVGDGAFIMKKATDNEGMENVKIAPDPLRYQTGYGVCQLFPFPISHPGRMALCSPLQPSFRASRISFSSSSSSSVVDQLVANRTTVCDSSYFSQKLKAALS